LDTPPLPLSNLTIQYTKPKDKPFKLADGEGLFLIIQPNGSKLWRLRYFFQGVERSLSIGPYPKVSITEARARREYAKEQIAAGVDPSVKKKLDRIASEAAARSTFGVIAEEYIARQFARAPAPDGRMFREPWRRVGIEDLVFGRARA
jgi:hypothetical protein